jgi:hypothetical protein
VPAKPKPLIPVRLVLEGEGKRIERKQFPECLFNSPQARRLGFRPDPDVQVTDLILCRRHGKNLRLYFRIQGFKMIVLRHACHPDSPIVLENQGLAYRIFPAGCFDERLIDQHRCRGIGRIVTGKIPSGNQRYFQ